ncbi:pyridoxamine 5'-phosphate oxidase family protein [Amycolatopsis saalfeldensis]|uniref:Pyridoxamine 5'-phosphate oxidase n=1 Tax=Amycolatopsis saalfeldensis TaxID=394193 RepID=A0A1H8XY13_9PSEU|nr:pyridoxamine 5'-phosphate oxidase family protein [Amycolatopsis saalfeldensis]SEP44716.1 Pyridoxamine 5'-phosphate oxidase [Amycolatopsis saalfeldensis]
MALTAAERISMLEEPVIANLSVDSGSARGPVCTPMWYRYDPEEKHVQFITENSARKVELLRKSGRATLLVQRADPTYRYATVEGPVSFSPASSELLLRIALRYLPRDRAEAYVRDSPVDTYSTVTLTPERWTGADLGEF